MDGHFYSREGVNRYFGGNTWNTFIYSRSDRDLTSPVLYLLISENSLKWFFFKKKKEAVGTCDYEPANVEPLYQLSLSPNLAVRNDLDSILAGEGLKPLPSDLLPKDTAARAYGYRAAYPSFQSEDTKFGLGALFLDFLFDLKHSRVFERCPGISKLESRLLEHPLVNAIHDKAEYFWCLKMYNEACRDLKKAAGTSDGDSVRRYVRLCAGKLIVAEGEWIDRCLAPSSETVFHDGQGWFDSDIGDELRHAVFFTKSIKKRKAFTWRAVCLYRLQLWDHGSVHRDRVYQERYRSVAAWLLRRYDVNGALNVFGLYISNLHQFFPLAINLSVLFSILCIGIASSAPFFRPEMTARLKGLQLSSSAIALTTVALLSFLIILYLAKKTPRKRTDFMPYHPARRLWLGGMTALLGMYLAVGVNGFSYEMPVQKLAVNGLLLTPVFFMLLLSMIDLIRIKCSPPFLPKSGWTIWLSPLLVFIEFLRLFYPRLVFALVGAWIFFVITEEFWVTSLLKTCGNSIQIGVVFLTVSLIYVMAKIGRVVRGRGQNFRRASGVVLMAFLMSFYIGVWAMSVSGPDVIRHKELLQKKSIQQDICAIDSHAEALLGSNDATLLEKIRPRGISQNIRLVYMTDDKWSLRAVYPWALLYRACFCVFIALFLQLVFEDKEITEPL
jgi:hypothetical protein